MHDPLLVLGSIGLVCAVTITISVHGLRRSRTTRDFYVASRRVPPWMNASAVAGEYLWQQASSALPGSSWPTVPTDYGFRWATPRASCHYSSSWQHRYGVRARTPF